MNLLPILQNDTALLKRFHQNSFSSGRLRPGTLLRLSALSCPLTRFRFVFLLLRPRSFRISDVRPGILSGTLISVPLASP